VKKFCLVFIVFAAACVSAQSKAQDDIKILDKQWLIDSYWTGDMTNYDRIVAPEFHISHSNGDVRTRDEKRADILRSKITDPSSPFRIGESSVKVFDKTAISNGLIIERGSNVRFTNVYIKRKGKWQVVSSHLTRFAPKGQ
jgi:hypothetical protein